MTNIELFEYSGKHPVPLIDPYYNKDKIIIPPTKELTNELIQANSKLIGNMRQFAKDAPEFFVFQMEGSEKTYRIPLAASMPVKTLMKMQNGFEGQVEILKMLR